MSLIADDHEPTKWAVIVLPPGRHFELPRAGEKLPDRGVRNRPGLRDLVRSGLPSSWDYPPVIQVHGDLKGSGITLDEIQRDQAVVPVSAKSALLRRSGLARISKSTQLFLIPNSIRYTSVTY